MREVCHFFTKLVAMATSLEILQKYTNRLFATKTLSFGEKIVKIGQADPEIIVF